MDNRFALATQLHTEAWKSDPFARTRIIHSMRRGDILPSDVITDAENIIMSRGGAAGSAIAQRRKMEKQMAEYTR